MLLSVFTIVPVTADAASVDTAAETGASSELAETGYTIPSEATFANRLAQLKDKYYPYGYCGAYYEDGYEFAWECYGFACQMFYDIFGIKYYAEGFVNMADYTMGELSAGDIVRIRGNTHSIFITKVTGSGYYFCDANWDYNNGVRWDAYYTKSEMAATFTYKVHVPGNNLKGTGSAKTGMYADTPKLKSVKSSAPGITVYWYPVDDASGYRVYYKGGAQKSWKPLGDTTNTYYQFIADLDYGTEYTFTVRAIDCYDELISKFDTKGITTKYNVAPPELISVKSGIDKISVSWEPVKSVGYYRLYAKGNTDTSWHTVAIVKGTSYDFTAGNAHTTYQFTVRCLNSYKKIISGCSPKCMSAEYITYATQLSAPDNIAASAYTQQGTVKISWNAVKNAKRYMVFYSRVGIDKGWKKLGVTTKNYCYQRNCTNNTVYRYTVRCVDDNNAFMSEFLPGAKLPYYTYPEKLKAVKKDDNGNIKVSWNAVKGASSYAVYYKTNGNWKRVATGKAITGTSYVFANCADGVKYTFTVRACDKNGKLISSYNPTGVSLTYKVTPKPTEAPTEAPSIAPTSAPTEAPTEAE